MALSNKYLKVIVLSLEPKIFNEKVEVLFVFCGCFMLFLIKIQSELFGSLQYHIFEMRNKNLTELIPKFKNHFKATHPISTSKKIKFYQVHLILSDN